MNAPDEIYAIALQELTSRQPVPGLFARAIADSGGDEAKTRALYIKYRVARLQEEVIAAAKEKARAEEHREEAADRERRDQKQAERRSREEFFARFPAARSLTEYQLDQVFELHRSGELSLEEAGKLACLKARNAKTVLFAVAVVFALAILMLVISVQFSPP